LGSQLGGFVPLARSDETVETQRTPAIQYKSLLKYFALRFCVAVTLGVITLVAV
jgi:hypothetical protein